MNTLTRVIGRAPSEIPFPEWLERLNKERKRAAREINLFKKGGKKSTYAHEVSSLLKKAGISGNKLQELIQKAGEKK